MFIVHARILLRQSQKERERKKRGEDKSNDLGRLKIRRNKDPKGNVFITFTCSH